MERTTNEGRRRLLSALGAVALAGAAPAWGQGADAAAWPDRPIRLIVPFSAGGVVDLVARTVGEKMAAILKQPVIVDNKTGAGGSIGTDIVGKSAPDGYTLLAVSPSHAVGPLLNQSISWNAERDFRAIGGFGMIPNAIVVPASSPFKTLRELIEAARKQPDSITYATAGIGTSNHLAAELMAQMAGVKLTHVPYKGQPEALSDVLGARVSMMALTVAIAQPQVKSGKLRALAVTSARRSATMPEVPTVAEAAGLSGYEVGAWFGLVVPRKTPEAVIRRLSEAAAQAVAQPDTVARLTELGMDVAPQSAGVFDRYVGGETRKWAKVLKAAGVSPQ